MSFKKTKLSLMVTSIIVSNNAFANVENKNKEQKQDEIIEEVVVRGIAAATRKSLAQQKDSMSVANFVSADTIGKLPDNNIAESLARLPGLNVIRDQQTGEGSRLSVRGLDGSLNSVSVNGIKLASGNRDDRSVSLNVLPTEGISGAIVRKTATPDIDGDFIGGSIDIKTPTAFDFQERHLNISAEGVYHERSESNGSQFSLSAADTFGSKNNIGIYFTAQYSKKDSVAEETENEGDWMLYNWAEDTGNRTNINPNSFMMQGLGLDLFENKVERFGFNTSFDFKLTNHTTIYLRGSHNKLTDIEDHNFLNVENLETDRLVQVDATQTDLVDPLSNIIGHNSALGNIYGFTTAQIMDLDGDGAITDADKDQSSHYTLYGASGIWDPEGVRLDRGFESGEVVKTLHTLNFGGETLLKNLTLEYAVAISEAEEEQVNNYEIGFRMNSMSPWLGNRGVGFSHPSSRYPQWQFNQAGLDSLNSPNSIFFDDAENSGYKSEDSRNSAMLDVEWKLNNDAIKTLKFGVKYSKSTREQTESEIELDSDNYEHLTLADNFDDYNLLSSRNYNSFFDGEYTGDQSLGLTFDRDSTIAFMSQHLSQQDQVIDERQKLEESVTAGYAMGIAKFNDIQIIAGVRVEHTKVNSNVFRKDEKLGDGFHSNSSDYTNVLPSINVNYHPYDEFIVRAAIWNSISRPEIQYMTGAESYAYDRDPDGDNIDNPSEDWKLISISKGNPDLEPTEATNFDLGFEYYIGEKGIISVNLFYKSIENFIFLNNNTDFSFANSEGVSISQPTNGQDATIAGIEFGLVQEFSMLPEPFNGLGLSTNLTLQKSESDTGQEWRDGDQSFINAPETIANLAVFWENYDWDIRLSYNYTGEYVEDLRSYAVDKYIQPAGYLDLQIRHHLSEKMSVSFKAQNLLEEHAYWATRGTNETYQKDYVEAGRYFRLAFNYEF